MTTPKKAAPRKRTAKPAHGRNRTAVDEMVSALEATGRLEQVDAARVTAARALADAVDSEPTNASLWREYRAALETLRLVDDGGPDDFAQLLADLSAEVGDAPKPSKAKPRA